MKTFLITNTLLLLCIIPGFTWAQFYTVSGFIYDSSSGQALENVSILESNSNTGTITNKNGFYRLVLTERVAELKFSYQGFKDTYQRIELTADTTLQVKLDPKINVRELQKKPEIFSADNTASKKKNKKQFPRF